MKQIIGLTSENFIQVHDSSRISYGGNQQWWEGKNKRFCDYGCGIISAVDTELFLTGKHSIAQDEYTQLATGRFKQLYHFLIARGVPFWKMSLGFWLALRKSNLHAFVWWAPSIRKDKVLSYIRTMLHNDYPVPASYFVFFKKNRLPLYRYDEQLDTFSYSQAIRSHYFTITGLYYDDKTDIDYLQLSSWGKCYYVKLNDWLKKRSVFSNILFYRIKSK